jgi:hypothetical protein
VYLKKTYRKESGRTYLALAQKYHDPKSGVSKDRSVKSLGYLDELEKEYEDPIGHFKELARKMTEEEKEKNNVTLSFDMDEQLEPVTDGRKNFGYAAILGIYHELELDRFFNNKARHEGFRYNTNSIMTLLIVSRILSPGSKKKAFEEKGRYFERFDFSLDDTYRSLSHFAKTARDAQRHIHETISRKYGRDTKTVYYDVTNFYFETDEEDDMRKKGVRKEHRPNPIVQMGLAMDADGVPVAYKTFPGNTGEIIEKDGQMPAFDFEKLAEEEKYDGYAAVVTSEMHMSAEQITDTYRGRECVFAGSNPQNNCRVPFCRFCADITGLSLLSFRVLSIRRAQ